MAVKKKEYFLSLDNFNQPSFLEGATVEALMIARLIMLEPGTNPLHPAMGVGLKSRYRYNHDLSALTDNVRQQMQQFLPEYNQDCSVNIYITPEKVLNIEITVSGGDRYTFSADVSDIHDLNDVNSN